MSDNQRGRQYKLRFLDDMDHKKLKEIAKEDHLPMNWLINQAIKKFLKESAKAWNQQTTKKPNTCRQRALMKSTI